MSNTSKIAVLGSTGSIGRSTLDVVRMHRERFSVAALAAHRNVEELLRQAREFRPELIALSDPDAARQVAAELGPGFEVLGGADALEQAAALASVQTVVAAVVGFAGFRSVLSAIKAGKNVALANKETLVAGGSVLKQLLQGGKSRIVPVDSEHSSIYQCLHAGQAKDVEEITLTASGGPFLDLPLAALKNVKPSEAVRHPRWKMGAKISVDSATLMNKGLEVIEAAWLFDLPPEKIKVLIHPQSIVHGMVAFCDGALMAALAVADMKLPIAYALAELADDRSGRIRSGVPQLKLLKEGALQFREVEAERFPALELCYQSLELGGGAPALINAANESAVAAYLREEIGFLQITDVVKSTLDRYTVTPVLTVDDIVETDALGRRLAEQIIRQNLR